MGENNTDFWTEVILRMFCTYLQALLHKLQIIPNHQFGFKNKHVTLEQMDCVTTAARNARVIKQYCCAVFSDVSQVFNKVWIDGLIHKIGQ